MMTIPDPSSPHPAQLFDAPEELEAIISLMARAHELETDLSDRGFDPALSALLAEAEMLWATASRCLQDLVREPPTPGPSAIAARHLLALLLSDGTNPRHDRQHLRDLASSAGTLSLPDSTRAQIARAADLMSQIFAEHAPFVLETPPSTLNPPSQGS